MKCPECVKEDKRSKVYPGGAFRTAMCIDHHYDENGKEHYHDPNCLTLSFSCSNGHSWAVSTYSKCNNCNYNEDR